MISEQSTKLLQEMKSSLYGKALQEFLDEQYVIINDVKTCKSLEEVRGRQLALQTLDKIFSFMREVKKEDKTKNQYI